MAEGYIDAPGLTQTSSRNFRASGSRSCWLLGEGFKSKARQQANGVRTVITLSIHHNI